jgi:hypothetical protein
MMVMIVTGLVAGSLDLATALLFFMSRTKQKPEMLLKYIASGIVGQAAFKGGAAMAVLGLCLHFFIAFCWVAFYFTIYPWVAGWEMGLWVDAIGYGLLVWVLMNLVVLPLSRAARRPFSLSFVLVNMVILMVMIGLPCAYAARHFR